MRNPVHLFGQKELQKLGRAVRQAREDAGLTQSQLAERSSLSSRALRDLEAGRSSPSLATMLAITDVLSISLDELIATIRMKQVAFGVLPGRAVVGGDNEVPSGLPQPRLKVRIVDMQASEPMRLPDGAAFTHVLGGSVQVALEQERATLRQGDSLHARPGVLGELVPQDGPARILLVETPG